ncbi:MAG: TatD family hydrolase [Promethearchaeota archaeon]
MKKKKGMVPFEPKIPLPLIDCHCHFPWNNTPSKMIESYDKQYELFFEEGGKFLISSSVDWKTLQFIKNYVENHDNMGYTAGWAPQTVTYTKKDEHDKHFSKWIRFLKENSNLYLGIGEIGLDFHHAKKLEKRTRQIDIFTKIIRETKNLNKPYILHVRNPTKNDVDTENPNHFYNEFDSVNKIIVDILENEKIEPSRVMWHCFAGPTKEWGNQLASKGYYLSAIGSAYGNKKMRKFTSEVPLSNILTETDAPYQHPYQYGEYNTPRNVKYAIAALAFSHSMEQENIANITLKNALDFFKISFEQ